MLESTATTSVARFYRITGGSEGSQNPVAFWGTAAAATALLGFVAPMPFGLGTLMEDLPAARWTNFVGEGVTGWKSSSSEDLDYFLVRSPVTREGS